MDVIERRYRHARPYVSPGRIQLVRARDGFRTRSVRLDDRTVAIRRAGQPGSAAGPTIYRLHRYRGPADYVYYHLAGSDYLFLPKRVIPVYGTVLPIMFYYYKAFTPMGYF